MKKMSVRIVKRLGRWVIPCREFVAVQLERDIPCHYRTKSNAVRAVTNERHNLITLLCHNIETLYARLGSLEKNMRDLANQSDVRGLDITCAAAVSGSCWPGGDNGATRGDNEGGTGGKGDTGDGGSDTTGVSGRTDEGTGDAS